MINSVSIKNYKAFSTGQLELKPITILLGANSSGKSSLMQLFLLIEQTINNREKYESALKLNGRFINLGEDENLIKDKNSKTLLHLEFGFSAIELCISLKQMLKQVGNDLNRLGRMIKNIKKEKLEDISGDSNFSEILEKLDAINTSIQFKSSKPQAISKNENSFFDIVLKSNFFIDELWNSNIKIEDRIEKTNELFSLLTPLEHIYNKQGALGYIFEYNTQTKKIEVKEHYIRIGDQCLLEINTIGLSSDILNIEILKKYQKEFLKYQKFDSLKLILEDNDDILVNKLGEIFNGAYDTIESFFDESRINYVSPLRAFPQRYYLLDEANVNTTLNTQSGTSLAELLKKNEEVSAKVNAWMNKFGLKVSVKEFKDIIHNIKINQNNLDLDITDVGFGISQVLPILVQGFLSKDKSLTLIEQPEIHLHPKMQADLADLFIDIVKVSSRQKKRKKLLIETHSEYILKRLRRRMSEGKLSSNDVAIYFIEPRNKNKESACIQKIEISKNGSFDWPEDFYITELEDDMAYFENVAKSKTNKMNRK